MRSRGRMGTAVAVLAVFAVVGLGCQPPSHPVPIDQVTVPRDFDFSMTKDVTVKVTVFDRSGKVNSGSVVSIGNAEEKLLGDSMGDNVLARGLTDSQGQFEQVVHIPARYSKLRVQALVYGVSHMTKATIQNNEVSVSLGTES